MISNEAIRQEVIDLLQGNIQGIQHFHNGRAVFTDMKMNYRLSPYSLMKRNIANSRFAMANATPI